MKKWKSILPIILCVCLTGCFQTDNEEEDTKKEEKEKLVLWSYYETDMQKTALDELVKGFNEYQDKYELTWEYHGPATEFNKLLAIGITQEQLPDMVIIDNPDMPRYIKMNRFEDITDEIQKWGDTESYFSNVIESVMDDGRYYGMPFCCNNLGLIYNKDIFREENIPLPRTWEEFEETAVKLTTEERKGFAMSAIPGEQSAFQIATWILCGGEDLQDIGGKGTEKAFSLIQRLVESNALSEECINWSQNDVARVFIDGECAMMENGPWVFPALESAGIDYGIVGFPSDGKYVGVTGGENLAVIKGKNIEGSIEFMKYYSRQDVMLNINLRANSMPPKEKAARLFLNVKPEYQVFMNQMKDCVSRGTHEEWTKLSECLSEVQYRVVTRESTAQEACSYIREYMGQ